MLVSLLYITIKTKRILNQSLTYKLHQVLNHFDHNTFKQIQKPKFRTWKFMNKQISFFLIK